MPNAIKLFKPHINCQFLSKKLSSMYFLSVVFEKNSLDFCFVKFKFPI